ncbi:MAG: aminodeoxychorismate lyase [Gammaproteobacteria bacterium]
MQDAEINETILVNGEYSADVSIKDRGLQYGHGLFETIAIKNGQLEYWDKHTARLIRGCQQLLISPPDPVLLKKEALLLTDQFSSDQKFQAVLKITVTCGEGGRGYKTPDPQNPTRILSISKWLYPEKNIEPVVIRLCKSRLSSNATLSGIKHLNRLEQVLARSEWSDPDIAEGIMLNGANHVIEGTMSNLFFVKNNTLCTPDLTQSGIQGIMREVILELANQSGFQTSIDNFTLTDIFEADELFLSNSLIKIWPVKTLIAKETITYNSPGDLTKNLISELTS